MERVNKILENKRFIYLLKELYELEGQREFCKHDIEHFLSVSRIMWIRALEEGHSIEKAQVYACGLLHDIGRVEQYKSGAPHGEAGAAEARGILGDAGFSEESIERICLAIGGHNSKRTEGVLGELLKEADKKSRSCMFCEAQEKCNWPRSKRNIEVQW